jgi:hypothetical protein
MVEVSRDSRRVYFTNSLYGSWDDQFYPNGIGAWMAKIDVAEDGGMSVDQRFFLEGDAFRGRRPPAAGRTRSGGRAATRQATPTATRRDQPYQRPRCTTSSNGRRSGRLIGASGRSAG